MALPYEEATSGASALTEVQKLLQKFGCGSFGHMMDFDEGALIVQFKYRDRHVSIKASFKGYAAAWLRENPHNSRRSVNKAEYERRALAKGSTAVYSIIRDWIKGQITAVECNILSFDAAFLGQIMLPNGQTVHEKITAQKLLPPSEDKTDELG